MASGTSLDNSHNKSLLLGVSLALVEGAELPTEGRKITITNNLQTDNNTAPSTGVL
jgi:hypothetical protein